MTFYNFDTNTVMLLDLPLLTSKRQTLRDAKKTFSSNEFQAWQKKLIQSQEQSHTRKSLIPEIKYPESLPVSQNREDIKTLIKNNQVVVVAGETGSGKTTQLPKMCLELGLADRGMIGHTQPRRLAAQTIAQRLSDELNSVLGEQVGYQIRFSDKTNANSLIKLMTDGILLSEIKRDPLLLNYQVIIIDEAHERSLNIDFLLGYLKRVLVKRADLKLIITSATINVSLFSTHFNNAPTFEVSGRCFPVETIYPDENSDELNDDLPGQVLSALRNIERFEAEKKGARSSGNVLVFFACERDIKDTMLRLKKHEYLYDQIYPLYARLARKDQAKIFSNHSRHRKIILSTNIAETSLTIPGVNYVIDSGQVRLSRYNYRTKVQQLPIEMISKASANQRQGRCGREGPGRCYRLYSEQSYELMLDETEPEILRTNLASVLLMSLELNIGPLTDFPFVQKPDNRFINDAFKLLEELQAINLSKQLSAIGKNLARLSVDPRLGRMIMAAQRFNVLSQVVVIASCLAIQDPREHPADKQDYARQMHSRFVDKTKPSDFHSILLLWDYFQTQKKNISNQGLRKSLSKECLNVHRLREWEDLVKQLFEQMKKKYQPFTSDDFSMDMVHRACLSGLLSHIGKKDENKEFIGARNKRFIVFPGSALYKKPPEWIMSAELVETDKLYGRVCGPFDALWLLEQASHLIKHQYSEPHWSKKHKQAMIYQSSLLYGLALNDGVRVSLSSIDKELARELFIKEVFVNATLTDYLKTPPKFWQHNQALINSITELEAKSRRMDVLLDADSLSLAYHRRLPANVYELNGFKRWLKNNEEAANNALSFKQHELMQHSALQITGEQFPEFIEEGEASFPLSYHFNPGDIDDGVSVTLPLNALAHCSGECFSWLVPGLLDEKCTALLKTLNKNLRKRVMPIPDTVHSLLFDLTSIDGNLIDFLCRKLYELKHVHIDKGDFRLEKLDTYYQLNIKIIDKYGKLISQNRNLNELKSQLNDLLETSVNHISDVEEHANNDFYTTWSFDALSLAFKGKTDQQRLGLYACLSRQEKGAYLKLLADPLNASFHTKQSLCFFVKNDLSKDVKYLEKNTFKSKEAALVLSREKNVNKLKFALVENSVIQTFFKDGNLPQTKQDYLSCLKEKLPELLSKHQYFEAALLQTLKLKQSIEQSIAALGSSFNVSLSDLILQLSHLFEPDFILLAGQNLLRYPYYLKAIQTRITKLPQQESKDLLLLKEASLYEKQLWQYQSQNTNSLHINFKLNHFRFLLEEFRISLFDQTIKTKEKISLKRLDKYWLAVNVQLSNKN